MVTRKAVPIPLPIQTSAPTNPPYPTSPVQKSAKTIASTDSNSNSVYSTDLAASPAFDLIDVRQAQQRVRRDSDSSQDTWHSDDTEQEQEETTAVPIPLNIRSTPPEMNGRSTVTADTKSELPPSLRIGAAKPGDPGQMHAYEEESQANPWAAEQMIRSQSNTNNPYLKQNGYSGDNSQAEWREVVPPMPASIPPPVPPQPSIAPPPLPPGAPPRAPPPIPNSIPSEPFAVKPPSRSSIDRSGSFETAETLAVPPKGQPPLPPVTSRDERPSSTWWNESEAGLEEPSASSAPTVPIKEVAQQEEHFQPPPGPPPTYSERLIDQEDAPMPSNGLTSISSPQPAASSSSSPAPDTPGTMLQKQRNTTYQIKHVNWLDESGNDKARARIRNSPIMTQNANGPCPLLALVNALVLTTPPDVHTPLLEVLSTREQISLGLLLDAVFEELMSLRRGGGSTEHLPDVSELYAFLLALHTGMNVNPRFVTPATTPRGSWDGVPPEMSGVHPVHKAQHKAGAFEETKEMRLYSTFNVPLIHGWIAPTDTPAYEAFVRSAPTFEDAQNIQFMQSDLEEKMRDEGLSAQETRTLEDIQTIKSFLNTWPTQLTDYGLETMSKSLQSGQTAILFRNDHFSTLYKEPKHGALMTLVTDAGYSGHDEIVWESLVDVNGAASELFSGDFRVVSHGSDVRLNQGNSGGGEEGWTTVSGKGRRKSSKGATPSPPPLPGPRPFDSGFSHQDEDITPPMTPEQRRTAEQEDHDLALALQLQEEEENQQREAEERRRREQELSEQFLSAEDTHETRPAVPPRRSEGRGTGVTINPRAPVSRPADNEDPDAPPSYEQAAQDQPYRPAGSTPSGGITQGNAIGAYDALRRHQSAYATQSSSSLPYSANDASPPYTATARRTSNPGNRIRRVNTAGGFSPGPPQRTNQIGFGNPTQRSLVGQGGLSPGHYPGSSQARSMQRVNEANGTIGVKDAEEKCVVM